VARARLDWDRIRRVAWERFGVRRFRPGQRELLEAVLTGRDALGILPTGAGKSLAFQLPAVLLHGTVVVASPLIALMRDQTDKLAGAEVDAARLDSTVRAGERRETEAELRRGEGDVVYVTPERLADPATIEPLRARGVALLAVDEAHCVSQWGHDFRPAYLGLAEAARALGRPPILAVTATSPPQVTDDIVKQLGLRDPAVVSAGIERPNLAFEVRSCADDGDKEAALLALLRDPGRRPAIVYCATIRGAVEVERLLRRAGFEAELYHGKLRPADRDRAQTRFMAGEVPVMVATTAFGMGIDKADVRLVAHWNFPDSVETYYQEAGRAGRDGAPATAVLLYRAEDRRIRSFFLGGRYPARDELARAWDVLGKAAPRAITAAQLGDRTGLGPRRAQVIAALLVSMEVATRRGTALRKAREFDSPEEWDAYLGAYEARRELDRERLQAMVGYAQTALCRVRYLRAYFGEPRGAPCGRCDNCRERPGVMDEVLRAEAEAQSRPGLSAPAGDW
jgi:ATP-dependent DNA helicase RecQ